MSSTPTFARRAREYRPPSHLSAVSPQVTLQLRAHETIRRHFLRSVIRVWVLLSGDLAAFVGLRALGTLVRDKAGLGHGVALLAQDLLTPGYLGGWRFAAALFVGLFAARNYGQGDRRRDSSRLLLGVVLATGLSLWQNVWVMGVPRVAFQFAATCSAFWLTLLVLRRVIDWVVREARERTGRSETVLFVGDPDDPLAAQVQQRLMKDGMASLGWVEYRNGKGGSRLTAPQDIWLLLQDKPADTVVLTNHLPEDLFQAVLDASAAAGCRTLVVPSFDGVGRLRPGLVTHHGISFVTVNRPGLTVPHLLFKRCVDLLGALTILIVLLPVLVVIAVLIKIDSPGPVLFTQQRVGLGGRLFQVVKFRTMRRGADAEKTRLAHLNHTQDPRLFKIPGDPRVTRMGALLRRWSLDELPQLWNVLVGDMSLVGPRPFPVSDLKGYQDHHYLRLSAKPGITGLWQVAGRSDIVDFEEVVRLDREYIERWSMWLDCAIMLRTVPAVLRRDGAY